eukprot:GHVN01042845.1.p3 GENE.GHVN01042845.1~~GHVN01042845.1.p3  ORF type:complete len:177 (-),score=22.05 GHVN01042845.1:1331-1861(-)
MDRDVFWRITATGLLNTKDLGFCRDALSKHAPPAMFFTENIAIFEITDNMTTRTVTSTAKPGCVQVLSKLKNATYTGHHIQQTTFFDGNPKTLLNSLGLSPRKEYKLQVEQHLLAFKDGTVAKFRIHQIDTPHPPHQPDEHLVDVFIDSSEDGLSLAKNNLVELSAWFRHAIELIM